MDRLPSQHKETISQTVIVKVHQEFCGKNRHSPKMQIDFEIKLSDHNKACSYFYMDGLI